MNATWSTQRYPVLASRPQEVPESRDAVVRWARDGTDLGLVPGYPTTVEHTAALERLAPGLQNMVRCLGDARNYWVTDDMVALLEFAMRSFPADSPCLPLPCPKGFLILQRPIQPWADMTFTVLGWLWGPELAVLILGNDPPFDPVHRRMESVSTPIPLTNHTPEKRRDDWHPTGETAWRLIASTMQLLQQRIGSVHSVVPDRSARRRMNRLGRDRPIETQIIDLRRPSRSEAAQEGAGSIEWKSRWIVDAFWRNQYMPSTRTHEPRWIAPYVKGPKHLPLATPQRVYALKH